MKGCPKRYTVKLNPIVAEILFCVLALLGEKKDWSVKREGSGVQSW